MKKKCQTPIAPSGHHPLRTLIVDDSTLLLACLRQLLDTQALVQVVGTAANGREALAQADALTPDLVLMDLHMPIMDGLQAAALLRRRLPSTRIIMMSLDETAITKATARALGVHGFVGKTQITGTLMAEIQRVCLLNDADDERGAA
jgi:two-component system, NarL family, nitrate/nitrite response regulator NarL